MKVAIHVDGPVIRGNELQVIHIATGLSRRGHEVVVSCRGGSPVAAELARRGVRTTAIRPGGDADLWKLARFVAWLRRERPDAILLTSWKRAVIGLAAARLARVPRIVFRIGGQQPLGSGLRGFDERFAIASWPHAIVTNAAIIADSLRGAISSLDTSRLHLVPNGIEAVPAAPAPIRRELGLGGDRVLIGAVGGAEPNKGWDLLIEAVACLPPEVHAVLVGGGTEPRLDGLRALAEARGLAARVHFLGRRGDVAAVLAACDQFVLSSRSEGMAVVMLEAMAARTPVVAFEVGAAREALGEREGRPAAGVLVPPEDVEALAAAIARVAAETADRSVALESRVAEGAWRVEHWFTVDLMVDRYEAVLAGAP